MVYPVACMEPSGLAFGKPKGELRGMRGRWSRIAALRASIRATVSPQESRGDQRRREREDDAADPGRALEARRDDEREHDEA
jgi:hypothetical protein